MLRALLIASIAAAACGGGSRPQPHTHTRVLPSLEATGADPGDVVVARVDGRPVWGSCVAAQAGRHGGDRRAGLDDCIALELGAAEAERRGLDRDPDVTEETTRALVARFVDRELTDKVRTVADLPPALVDAAFAKSKWRLHRPEYRATFFARIELADASRGTADDQAAGDAARAAYATLAARKDLFPQDVEQALRGAAGARKVSTGTPDPTTRDAVLQPYYRDAVFALTDIGTVAPPVRGPYGWDLILYTGQLTELDQSKDEVLSQLWPAMRLKYFLSWADQLRRAYDVQEVTDKDDLRDALGTE